MYSLREITGRPAMPWMLLICCVTMSLAWDMHSPRVVTTSGEVAGEIETFESEFLGINRKVAAYHGIPYAEPPLGDLRFKRPSTPVAPWEGVYEVTEMPPGCPQVAPEHLAHIDAAEVKSENCLFVNVFVPIPTPIDASVMVFIHGGGLSWGTGLNYPADPLPLTATGSVILVTMNYRLGAFGFLSTGDEVIPPNIGLYDQRAALKWVHENAKAFGGDPNSVTVFGNEAGAASVGWHLLSADSRQYFQRAILQSGTPLDDAMAPITAEEALSRTNLTAGILGCSFKERQTKELLRRCILETHASDLVSVSSQLKDILEGFTSWGPVIDGDFFSKSVEELLLDGGLDDIDVIIGANKNDGTFRIFEAAGYPKNKPSISKTTFHQLSRNFGIGDSAADILSVFYQNENRDETDYLEVLSGVVTDTKYFCNVNEFASSLKAAGSKVYVYDLTHDPETESVVKLSWAGAGFMEDLKYLFGLPFQTDLPFPITEGERVVSAHFMRLWTNFAKTGDPNLSGGTSQPGSKHPIWPEYTTKGGEYKEMSPELANGRNLRARECYAWDHVIPRIESEFAELEELKLQQKRGTPIAAKGSEGHDEL